MAKIKKITAVFCTLMMLLCLFVTCFAVSGCKREPIVCYFDVINPETGESLKYDGIVQYKDAYLTYDGEQKQLDIKVVRKDNKKQIKIKSLSFSTKITYVNPITGKYEYDQPYMLEKGQYFFFIVDYEYDTEKYYILNPATITVFIE